MSSSDDSSSIGIPVPTRADTIAEILKRSGRRSWVPIRTSALQQGEGRTRTPGPLIELIKHKDPRALELYLLVHALASKEPFDATLANEVWARSLGIDGAPASQRTAISRITRRLVQAKLIERKNEGRKSALYLLDESGNGEPYVHPAGKARYFKLPHAYWLDGWHERLGSPGKIVLLIGLSLKPGFILPVAQANDWYGLSSDTVRRGLEELEDFGLLGVNRVPKPAPLVAKGFTYTRHFTLLPPFDRDSITPKRGSKP